MPFLDFRSVSLRLRRISIEWRLRAARAIRSPDFDRRLRDRTESERVQILARALAITEHPLGSTLTPEGPPEGPNAGVLYDLALQWVMIAYRYDEQRDRIRLLTIEVIGPSEPPRVFADYT